MIKANWVWALPTFHSNALLNGVAGGWQWGGIFSILTGEPIEVTLSTPGTMFANDGVADSTARPNLVGKAQTGKGLHNWLSPNAFAIPTIGTFGNAGVAVARLPHQTQLDSSITKDFHIYNQMHMQFNLSAINALNHTLFNGVNSSFNSSSSFGYISSATTPRVVQAGLHLNF
jgi:hypothetical protein